MIGYLQEIADRLKDARMAPLAGLRVAITAASEAQQRYNVAAAREIEELRRRVERLEAGGE